MAWFQYNPFKFAPLSEVINKEVMMNAPTNDEEEDQVEVFLDENDIVQEIAFDDGGPCPPPPLSLSLSFNFFYV